MRRRRTALATHWHFLSRDHQHGGHLLQCRGRQLRLQIQREGTLSIALPETEDFLQADLRQDPSVDREKAETDHRGPVPTPTLQAAMRTFKVTVAPGRNTRR